MRVGVDIDGTLNDLDKKIAEGLAKEKPVEVHGYSAKTWYEKELGRKHYIHDIVPEWGREDIGPFFARNQWMFDEAPLKDYAIDMLYGLRLRNFKFLILTHRTTEWEVPIRTAEWLDRSEVAPFMEEVHHASLKGRRLDKYQYAVDNKLNLDVMMEDKLEVAIPFLKAKIPVILFNYEHNQGYDHPLLHRVNNWWEAYQALCTIQIRSKEWQK